MGRDPGVILAVFVFAFIVMFNACADGDKTIWDGTIFVEHQVENLPDSVHHVRYAIVDEQGNQASLSSAFAISSLHVLPNIPINATAIIIEFCAENGEVLDEDVQPIAFTATLRPVIIRNLWTDVLQSWMWTRPPAMCW